MRRALRRRTTSAALFLAIFLSTAPVWAHKLTVFAAAQGKTIAGEAYFRGGSPVRGVPVAVLGAGGEKLGELTTNDEGKFTFEPRVRVDHRFVVNAGEGHTGEFVVQAAELPATLPAGEGSAVSAALPKKEPENKGGQAAPVLVDSSGGTESRPNKPAGEDDSTAALSARIEQLNQQVAELRKDLVHYQDEVRLHDLLGGIGVILGFMGLTFYFLGVRRKEKMKA